MMIRRLVVLACFLSSFISVSKAFQACSHHCRTRDLPATFTTSALLVISSSSLIDDDGTVSSWTTPLGQTIVLIGTAHLSQKSKEQVQQVINETKPNIVMVELDKTRLSRIGIDGVKDIKNLQVVTSEDIMLPNQPKTPWYGLFLQAFAQIARKMLTGMYNDMSNSMNNKDGGGGEFLAAIRAAEACDECNKLVLGDRDSVTTIQRAAQFAFQSGKPFKVFQKLSEANSEEMQQLEDQLREELGDDVETGEFQVAMMERLKSDTELRNRLFARLEQEVPEFIQPFLKERDYIMSQAIGRELQQDPEIKRAVAVVGLAHVPGIQANIESMFQGNNERV